MKNEKYHTVGTVPKSNWNIRERRWLNTFIYIWSYNTKTIKIGFDSTQYLYCDEVYKSHKVKSFTSFYGYLVSSTNKTVRYGITEVKQMLTMALSKYQQNYKEIVIIVLWTRLQNWTCLYINGECSLVKYKKKNGICHETPV